MVNNRPASPVVMRLSFRNETFSTQVLKVCFFVKLWSVECDSYAFIRPPA